MQLNYAIYLALASLSPTLMLVAVLSLTDSEERFGVHLADLSRQRGSLQRQSSSVSLSLWENQPW
jgi:hypothetical protein